MLIRKLNLVGRTYRHLQRYREILVVLLRYGFDDLVRGLKVEQYLEMGLQAISRKRRERVERLSRAERVRMVLEELGPTFIKMGQILSTRPDLLPAEFIRELSRLQDRVPPFPWEEAEQILQAELGGPIESVFEAFDRTPLASASLGQVYRGRLIGGEEVVVKIRRPRIRKTIEVDLEILLHLATLMERHMEDGDLYRPTRFVEEFSRTLERELDYEIEAAHLERFSAQFASDPDIRIPRVYRELTSSRLLALEYLEGIKISEIDRLREEGFDLSEIARKGARLIMKQIFVHGFFHADPHPGNVLVLPDGAIGYLDFGMMGRLCRETREKFAGLLLAVVRRQEAKVARRLIALTEPDGEPDYRALERDVAEYMERFLYRPIGEVDFARSFQQMVEMVARHRLRLPPEIFFMIKALVEIEGIGRRLDPGFDLVKEAAPFVRRLYRERLRPGRLVEGLAESGEEFFHLMGEIPRQLRQILEQIRQGRVHVEIEHRGLEPLLSSLDRLGNQLSFAIVLGSLVVGSSLVVLSGIPPLWHEIPVVGLIGFLVAGIMGFWLLISILRRGRM